jgi:hypothetical protein
VIILKIKSYHRKWKSFVLRRKILEIQYILSKSIMADYFISDEDLPIIPVDYQLLPTLKQRLNLALKIDVTEHRYVTLQYSKKVNPLI